MQCLNPRNGVPCGTCPRCRLNRQRDWTFRLSYERDASDFVFWLSLTFDDAHLVQVLSSEKAAREPSRHFIESLRKKFGNLVKIKHYLVTEYGDQTDRFHHHCLLFVKSKNPISFDSKMSIKKQMIDFLGINDWDRSGNTCWPFGGLRSKPLHSGVFPYVTDYVNKPELLNKEHKIRPFTRISQGIGIDFLNRADKKQLETSLVVSFDGSKKVLPRYYREKLFPRSKYNRDRALLKGDFELYNQIQDNRHKYEHYDAYEIAYKNHNLKELQRREFERTHSITYDEYERHLAANEFRKYQDKLKKRQNF